tara:strand:- start:507 stop:659 length:153 start_codon:yes stop_codon:yes gene_type:complete
MEKRLAEIEKKLKETTIFLIAIIFFIGVLFGFTYKKLNLMHNHITIAESK